MTWTRLDNMEGVNTNGETQNILPRPRRYYRCQKRQFSGLLSMKGVISDG